MPARPRREIRLVVSHHEGRVTGDIHDDVCGVAAATVATGWNA